MRPFPISIDFERQAALAVSTEVEQEIEKLRAPASASAATCSASASNGSITPREFPSGSQALDRFFERYPGLPRASHVRAGWRSQPRAHPFVPADRRGDRPPGRADQLEVEHVAVAAGHLLQASFLAGRDDGLASSGQFLHRQLAARRNEPGCQGVRRQPAGRGRRLALEPVCRARRSS